MPSLNTGGKRVFVVFSFHSFYAFGACLLSRLCIVTCVDSSVAVMRRSSGNAHCRQAHLFLTSVLPSWSMTLENLEAPTDRINPGHDPIKNQTVCDMDKTNPYGHDARMDIPADWTNLLVDTIDQVPSLVADLSR